MTSTEFQGIRFIFHFGAGKTGTSSIQASLRDQREHLLAHGVMYLGLVLEHAPFLKYPWQKFGATGQLHRLSQEIGSAQILDIILSSMNFAREREIHTLIWSSESFFDRPEKALPALYKISEMGAKVYPVVYVRRHDVWASSAFIQWGIKHKTFQGPINPFKTWVKRRPIIFYERIQKLNSAFPGNLIARNFDTKKDVVFDFFKFLNIPLTHQNNESSVNKTGSGVETILRALFNTSIKEPTPPHDFNQQVARKIEFTQSSHHFLQAYWPTQPDLQAIFLEQAPDRHYINTLLQKCGQPELDETPSLPTPETIDFDYLLFLLAVITTRQAARLHQLEQRWALLQHTRTSCSRPTSDAS